MSEPAGSEAPAPVAFRVAGAGDRRWPSWLRLHFPTLLGVIGSLSAGWFEWSRAVEGRQVAWVYAIEWPVFASLGVLMWWRTWREEDHERRLASASRDELRPGKAELQSADAGPWDSMSSDVPAMNQTAHLGQGGKAVLSADPELLAWRAYLDRLQTADPPGGPPQRDEAGGARRSG